MIPCIDNEMERQEGLHIVVAPPPPVLHDDLGRGGHVAHHGEALAGAAGPGHAAAGRVVGEGEDRIRPGRA